MVAVDPVEALMDRALALAERGGGGTAPNPMVGCVLADPEGRILGEGYHARAGGPHAEVAALRAVAEAGRSPAGATAVVTLEPCAAANRTPPCVEALREAGVARVVYATPDPHIGAGGADRLRAAGIEARAGPGGKRSRRLNDAWFHWIETGRPLVHVKTAQTLNGRVTLGREDERWITGPEARRAVHRLRRRYRAVLVGVGTVLADDPELTVRELPEDDLDVPWPDVQPLRVVLDTRLRIPPSSRLLETADRGPVLVLAGPDASERAARSLADRGAEVARVPLGLQGLDLARVVAVLAERDVTGVLAEPGPTLATALLDADVVDRWTMFLAPDWAASRGALPLLLADGGRSDFGLDEVEWRRHGRDASVSGRVRRGER